VWGVEPNPKVAEVAKTRLDHVVVDEFPSTQPLGSFDCVTFLDVLEHFQQPWDVLRSTRALVADGGSVVAAIPNVRHYSVVLDLLRRGRWTYVDDGILDRTHLRFFTRASMIELFQDSGYDVETIRPANMMSSGRAHHVLRMAGKRGEEFHAMHYVVLARPRN
jgi:2-polyprenyl-3-methyl-5-hydroxy-6-metoxy-1,4-benzoquinol methylase